MFEEMINGSRAVLTNPSVATFEEHERDNLQWALIYSVCAGVINAILNAIRTTIFPQPIPPELAELGITSGSGSIIVAIPIVIIFTTIGLLFYWGLTYALGKAFGGTGNFGELTYDMALFSAPMTIIGSALGFIPFIGGLAGFVLFFYNLYLTYLAVQAGMNLPSNKAIYVIAIQFAIIFVLAVCIGFFVAAIFAAALSTSG
ncbi:MAG: YIP1 family protein [Candidatus Viridilinea halotolerans]|uniref:YIP1 family protein n=1 Tax=Candidatus Viridilinea halotolerans TaxID=2491704 RepID=A0A426TXL0_9CHLR|nr:MAG: YIP1 family protein [Candidatus Viridilinea halotolerans]